MIASLIRRPPAELLIYGGAAALLVASFLPWYRVYIIMTTVSLTAWDEPGLGWSAGAVTAAVMLAVLLATRGEASTTAQRSGELRVLGLLSLLPLAGVTGKYVTDSDFIAYGFYVSFAAALAIALGGALLFRQREPTRES